VKLVGLICCIGAAFVAVPAAGGGPARDDTAALQAQLDAGGNVFIPKLPNGECYATRGLWVSHDRTTITSDGACLIALGPGEARMKEADGTPIRATSVFHIDHSDVRRPLPVRIHISGLRIVVPASARVSGIRVFAHEVDLNHLTISGSPIRDIVVGAGAKGAGGMMAWVDITDCELSGGQRDVITAFGPIGLRVERNTLSGARGLKKADTAAGLHIRAADRGQPTLNVRVADNKIVDNAGPGILFDLAPANGAPVFASGIDVNGNEVLRNGRKAPLSRRAGIVLAGGQRDGKGSLALAGNTVRGNRGPGVLGRSLRLVVSARENDLSGNAGGTTKGLRGIGGTTGPAQSEPSRPPASTASPRDDTAWLQARLDRGGGTIFLPKLANGECYATRGLWVSHDDTTITSDGACVTSLGLGAVRLRSNDGDPIASSAVFFVNRSNKKTPAPVGVTISNLRIIVPDGQGMYGVATFGHYTTLSHLDIGGAPKDDVLISSRANGNSYVGGVAVLDSTLSGAQRNAISATGVINLRIEGNTIQGVRDIPPGQPAAGIDLEPDDRGQPAYGVRIVHNTIQDNAGPGIMLELESNDGHAVLATGIEITDNMIVRNALKPFPPKRAGIVLAGGQDGTLGTLSLLRNAIRGNGGPGILASRLRLLLDARDNDLTGNSGGPTAGFG
jgi:parallel beta helix pectate lyase-like protein